MAIAFASDRLMRLAMSAARRELLSKIDWDKDPRVKVDADGRRYVLASEVDVLR